MQLSGETFQIALQRTEHPIELRDRAGARVATLTDPAQLVMYIERGYQAHGSKRRVRYLAPGEPRAALRAVEINPWVAQFIACWRNQSAAVLWPWTDQQRS